MSFARRTMTAAVAAAAGLMILAAFPGAGVAQQSPDRENPHKQQRNPHKQQRNPHAQQRNPHGDPHGGGRDAHGRSPDDPHAGHDHAPGEGHGHSHGAGGHSHGADGHSHGGETPPAEFRPAPWDKQVLKLVATLPTQDRGRIKPLDTYAGFILLKLNGKRTCKTPKGEKLNPVAWLLDTVFFPRTARTYEVFRVQNSEVITAIGLDPGSKRKRDYYSYEFIEPGIAKLFELAGKHSRKASRDGAGSLEPVERETTDLAKNIQEYSNLLHSLDWARATYSLRGSGLLKAIYDSEDRKGLGYLLEKIEGVALLGAIYSGTPMHQKIQSNPTEMSALRRLASEVQRGLRLGTPGSRGLVIFPAVKEDKTWYSAAEVAGFRILDRRKNLEKQVALLSKLEELEQNKTDPTAFKSKLQELHQGVTQLADERGEYSKIPLEVAFYRGDYFFRALLIYLLALLVLVASWMFPKLGASEQRAIEMAVKLPKPLRKPAFLSFTQPLQASLWGLMTLATLLVVIGITLRCVINSRPPVTTLYETILFIAGCAVISGMLIEWINRQRIAMAVSVFMGVAGMFLAMKYEFQAAKSAGDTLEPMRAVLDTNFWLSTHVTTVTLGYAAGLLASGLAHVWVLGKMFGFRRDDRAFYRAIVRMTYGVICFGLLFSVVGTILGGIWANYSWGRFWGWDPKENGALMICLWELMILHARMGGYIRDHGLCVLAILGGTVVAFSWWGVNLLNVGLHSYGFTTGVFAILMSFYVIEGLIVLASGAWRLGQIGRPDAKIDDGGTAIAEPAAEEPAAEEPKAEEPKAEEPKAEEPKAEEPKAEEPEAEEPEAEEPKAEEPEAEEPEAEEPEAEEPEAEADEPKAEEPEAEEPKAEEPKAEEPKADEPEGVAEQPEGVADMPEGTADDPKD